MNYFSSLDPTKTIKSRSLSLNCTLRGLCGVLSLVLGLTLIAPATVAAQSQARVCVHVPQGKDFNSGWAPFVLVLRDKSFWTDPLKNKPRDQLAPDFLNSNQTALTVNIPSSMAVAARNVAVTIRNSDVGISGSGGKMNFGYNCRVIPLGVSGENRVNKFNIADITHIDAVVYGKDDFCADEVYIQRFENGQLIGRRRFMLGDQKCWGDDLPGAAMYHTLKGQPVTQVPAAVFVSAEGFWDLVCSTIFCESETTNTNTNEKGESRTNSETNSTEVTKSVSAGIEHSGISMSAEYSKTEKNEVTNSITTDIRSSKTYSKTSKLAYGPDARYKYNIGSIWHYAIKVTVKNEPPKIIYSRFTGCTSDEFKPKFAPGSPEAGQSCQGGLGVRK